MLSPLIRNTPRSSATTRGLPAASKVRPWIAAAQGLERAGLRRLRIPVPTLAVGAATKMARVLGRDSLAEKLATFFFKDLEVLEGLLDPPETTLSASETEFITRSHL